MIKALDHLVLTVCDLDATIRFYQDALGMEPRWFGENNERCSLHFGSQKINLHEQGKEFEPKAATPTPGAGDLCFLTDQPVEDVKARLEAKGLSIIEGPVRRSGAAFPLLSIYLRDPDGNLIEIAHEADPV